MTRPEFKPGDRVLGESPALRGLVVRIEDDAVVLETKLGRVVAPASQLRLESVSSTKNSSSPARKSPFASMQSHRRDAGSVTVHYDDDPLDETLDLHGCRAEEVELLVTGFIDRAILRGHHRVKINHGKGTGTLLREVKRCLRGMRQVERIDAAEVYEGSYGVTVAWLK